MLAVRMTCSEHPANGVWACSKCIAEIQKDARSEGAADERTRIAHAIGRAPKGFASWTEAWEFVERVERALEPKS